jgi:hypothetical protein
MLTVVNLLTVTRMRKRYISVDVRDCLETSGFACSDNSTSGHGTNVGLSYRLRLWKCRRSAFKTESCEDAHGVFETVVLFRYSSSARLLWCFFLLTSFPTDQVGQLMARQIIVFSLIMNAVVVACL